MKLDSILTGTIQGSIISQDNYVRFSLKNSDGIFGVQVRGAAQINACQVVMKNELVLLPTSVFSYRHAVCGQHHTMFKAHAVIPAKDTDVTRPTTQVTVCGSIASLISINSSGQARFSIKNKDGIFLVTIQKRIQKQLCKALKIGEIVYITAQPKSFYHPKCKKMHVSLEARTVIVGQKTTDSNLIDL
ncbi:MAG: hypothetical protein AAF485_12530 [Chloroflexota bacterium]